MAGGLRNTKCRMKHVLTPHHLLPETCRVYDMYLRSFHAEEALNGRLSVKGVPMGGNGGMNPPRGASTGLVVYDGVKIGVRIIGLKRPPPVISSHF